MRRVYLAGLVLGLVLLLAPLVAGPAWFCWGIDDERRAAFASHVLSRLFPGHFTLGAFAFEGVGDIHLTDVLIEAPTGEVVARADKLSGTFSWLPVLSGRFVFSDIQVQRPWVRVEETALDGPMLIELAFIAPRRIDAHDTPQKPRVGWSRVELKRVNVHNADLAVRTNGVLVHATGLDVRNGDYWIQGDSMALTAELDTRVKLRTPSLAQEATKLHISASDIHYLTARRYDKVDAKNFSGTWEGGSADLHGYFFVEGEKVKEDSVDVTFSLDTAQPLMRLFLPPSLLHDLHGTASGHLAMKEVSGKQRVAFELTGKKLGWRKIALDNLNLLGGFKEGEAVLDTFVLQSGHSRVGVEGAIAWLPGPRFGRHHIKVTGTDVALQRLLGPFVARPGLLPEKVTFTAACDGRSLWPMTAEMRLSLKAWDVPGGWLPGVPDPITIAGTAMVHPDLIEVLRFQIGDGDYHPKFAVQGGLKTSELGVIDVITHLHRIPVIPVAAQAEDMP